MEDIILTITERLKDLRKECGLTLEALSKAVGISRSALGAYETGEFKDISPFSIVKLAKFYGVTTDYLMGMSNMKKEADAEVRDLRLTDGALQVLKNGHFNGKLLSEVICHEAFPRLMTDMEIFVDCIASMQIDSLNSFIGSVRDTVQAQYHPDENEQFYRALEVARVSGDEYMSSVLLDDLTDILRDIRGSAGKKEKDESIISQLAAIEEFQEKVLSVIEAKGSKAEQAAKVYRSALGIDYDSLTPEEFVVLMEILNRSSYKETSINRRGRRQFSPQKKGKK